MAKILQGFEESPGAHGLLKVLAVYKVQAESEAWRSREAEWMLAVKKLSARACDPDFPKPTWKDSSSADTESVVADRFEREEVLRQLTTVAEPREDFPKVQNVNIYHGCPSLQVALSIFRLGFAANVQKTKGWFGEGVYATTEAAYALRYTIGMQDFWENSVAGQSGYVIAGRAVYSHAYPVTRAENEAPLKPGLKGTRIAFAPGARGADLQFACVRGVPPNDDHNNRTYHSAPRYARHEATELVTNQEAHLLPEYIVHVGISDDSIKRERLRKYVEDSGLHGISVCVLHMKELQEMVGRLVGRAPASSDIKYQEVHENGYIKSTVMLCGLNSEHELTFSGTPETHQGRAQQTAAMAAVTHLKELDLKPGSALLDSHCVHGSTPMPLEAPRNFKNELQALVQQKLRRSTNREDIVYNVQAVDCEVGPGLWRCNVSLRSVLESIVQGPPRSKSMDAQQAAAETALQLLSEGRGEEMLLGSAQPSQEGAIAESSVTANQTPEVSQLPQPPSAPVGNSKSKVKLKELQDRNQGLRTEYTHENDAAPFRCKLTVSWPGKFDDFNVLGSGTSKKVAEQDAAKQALEQLEVFLRE